VRYQFVSIYEMADEAVEADQGSVGSLNGEPRSEQDRADG
jgi:hypothetical protein